VLLVTMPGLPMFGHGQIEGFHEKYGMEYRRAYWDEEEDRHMVAGHESMIFPLARRRHLFSGSENFTLYDFFSGNHVDENVFAFSNSSGGEHGLILYNNRYGETKGWIHRSTAMARKNNRGETILVQKTLGDALGCNPDGKYYYSFRDYVSGREFLRSGREISANGLYAELGGYEFKTFLDFREIIDDDYGSWGKLCARLNGEGAASLEEELKQVRYGKVIASFREAVAAASGYLAGKSGNEGEGHLLSMIKGFYEELSRHTACSGDCALLAADALLRIASVDQLQQLFKGEAPAEFTPDLERSADRLLLAAWLVLCDAGRLAGVEDDQMVIVSWLGELGLERAFRELATEAGGDTVPSPSMWEEVAALLKPVLRWRSFFTAWEMESATSSMTLLFADPGAREFLKCHTYEDYEWFNRERFILLLHWLVMVEAMEIATGPEPYHLKALPGRHVREIHRLQAIADAAGYRLDRFLRMLEAEATA
ncbi:MAG TPA: alpha-amylase, partial [Geobacteraceae bacterium]|nr:alpha-amylase [Geobacteraceae bacterium]